MKKHILFQGLAGLAAWGCLSGLALVRFWAVLYGHLPGELILAAAVALSGAAVLAVWKLGLAPRLLLPLRPPLENRPGRWGRLCTGGPAGHQLQHV